MRNLLILPLILALAACQSVNPERHDSNLNTSNLSSFSEQHHELIADNLVNALTQLDGLYPAATTLQIPDAKTPFGVILLGAVSKAGYGMQAVEGDLGINLLRFRAENSETEFGFRTVYRVDIGKQYVEREYNIKDNVLMPTSPMRVSGSKSSIVLNDSVFEGANEISMYSVVVAKSEAVPVIKTLGAKSGSSPYNIVDVPQPQDVVSLVKKFAATKSTQNIYVSSESNYADLLSGYKGVSEQVLIFPNDSLKLGGENKQLIQTLAKSFDPEHEVISVLGCSQGKTSLDDGNQYLAVGRADRVRNELLANGIQADRIFDEGCWGQDHRVKDLPTRGVVLSRKRLTSS